MKFDHLMQAAEDFAKNTSITQSPKSISSYAAKAIYYFPVLCSKTVSGKTAFTIANNLEASYCSFITACFSLVPAVSVSKDYVNVEDYLKLFHQNIGIKSGTDFNISYNEDAKPYDMFVNDVLNEAGIKNKIKSSLKIDDGVIGSNKSSDSNKNKQLSFFGEENEQEVKKPFTASEPDRISEQQTEKHNKLKPSIVNVTCTFIISGKDVQVKIPVGVKTVIHSVNTNELCDHIMDSIAGKGLFHNLIRYTTGEVLSLGDILFGISKIKKTVASSKTSEVSRWVDAIEHRKRLNRLSRAALQKKPYLPNVSVVLSMDDINDMEHLIGYNLFKDTHRAVKFMKDNFLLTFVIADDMSETAYILYDGHATYEEYPYNTLKRENERNADAMAAISKSLGIK